MHIPIVMATLHAHVYNYMPNAYVAGLAYCCCCSECLSQCAAEEYNGE